MVTTIIREREIETNLSIYTVGATIDELKPHKDGNGKPCLKGRGKIEKVEKNIGDTTATIRCDSCHQTVKESS